MTSSTLTELVIGLAVIAYICSRQLTWRSVDPSRLWRLPLILGAVGVVSLTRQTTALRTADVVVLAVSGLVALGSGTLMGSLARYRQSPSDPRLIESRTGWLGAALWLVLIAVRIGIDVAGHRMGSDLAVSTGTILLMLALNRAGSALVVTARQPHRSLAVAGK